MKKSLAYLLTTTVLVFLATGCQSEIYIDQRLDDSIKQGTKINYVTDVEVPEIINSITDITGTVSIKSSPYSKSINYKNAKVDLNQILKLKNKDNITNYTFGIAVEGAPLNEFYNLVVNESPSGKVKKPYVVKYVVDDDALDNFVAHNGDFGHFKGIRYIMSFNSFFDDKDVNITKSGDCPDDGIPVDNTGTGDAGGLRDIPISNYLQTDHGGYNYTNTNPISGESFGLYLNSYDTYTNNDTSYGDVINNDDLVSIGTSTSQASIEIWGIQGTNYTLIQITGSNGNVIIYGASHGGIYVLLHQFYIPQAQKSDQITKADGDCPGDSGEVGVVPQSDKCSYLEQRNGIELYTGSDGKCYPDNIFAEELDGNAKCAFDKLKEENSNLYRRTIGVFDKDASNHIRFRRGVLADCNNRGGTVACTDDTYLDSYGLIIVHVIEHESILESATTILHEGIHSELYRFVHLRENGNVDPNDRPRLMQLYSYAKGLVESKEINSGELATRAQHMYMAEYYVKPIAETIRDLDGRRFPLENYMGFGWTGLTDTYNFKNLLTKAEKAFYTNKMNEIINSTSAGDGCN